MWLIDWTRPYESLDTIMQQVVREDRTRSAAGGQAVQGVAGRRHAGVATGPRIEVQNQPDERFDERMYVYNYRIHEDAVAL